MGREYTPALDMFVDEQRTFIGALQGNKDLSIVIHGSGSPVVPTAQELGLYFASNAAMLSSHFVIDRNGVVVQCVSLKDGAAANCCLEPGHDKFWDPYNTKYGNLNKCTISIEHANNADNSLALTDAQKKASFALVQFLCKKYNIPVSRIKTHASLDPQSRAHCPGNYPMQELLDSMATKTPTETTVSESTIQTDIAEIQADIVDEEAKLAALRGLVVVKGPTVIE